MKTLLTSFLSAATAAVIAALVVIAIDDDPAPASVPQDSQAVSTATTEEPEASRQPIAATDAEEAATPAEPEGRPVLEPVLDEDFDPIAIFDAVGPSVVSIRAGGGSGTGFFIDDLGHVVTNYHVIQGATNVMVIDAGGNFADGEVLGFDRANDLAIILIDPTELDVLPVTLGDSDLAQVGEPVAALGSPFGLEQTLTTGIVSAIERTRQGLEPNGRPQRGLIQTDASINPGNSGGVLVNADGEVIGITNSVESPIRGSVGVGFAIPSNVLVRFLPQMIDGEDIAHPWLGISGTPDTSDLQIGQVVPGAPAALAGLLAGDELLDLDGIPLNEFEQLAVLLDSYAVGDEVTFNVDRGGDLITVAVELGAWPG